MSASTASAASTTSTAALARYLFAGFCASLVTIGLARFVYTPLLPALIQAHWFTAADTVYLGAANLGGYLAGALAGRALGRRWSNAWAMRVMMGVTVLSFMACAVPLSVGWFFAWRFASGVAGGVVMVLVAATVLPYVPAARRGSASGVIFIGAGLGIAASGTIVPLLLDHGLQTTWLGLGVFSLLLTMASWRAWPAETAHVGPAGALHGTRTASGSAGASLSGTHGLTALYVAYALMATGFVPGMVFLVDYIARGLHAGAHVGALFWILYGMGAIIGPAGYGWLADRCGSGAALRGVLVLQAVAMAALGVTQGYVALGVLSVLLGTFTAGLPPLVLSRLRSLLSGDTVAQNVAWSRATTVFAALQAAAGYGYSAVFNASEGNHALLFFVGGAALAAALAVEAISAWRAPRPATAEVRAG